MRHIAMIVATGPLFYTVGANIAALFRPGFHPCDHDDRALLAEAERRHDLATT